jgi:crotonobetainyl-CoA:carnitine CoA-transferase CaiB-like acyl-CoA transferase
MSKTGPFSGVRVLDLSTVIAGPWAAGILTDQGAECVKIEPPGRGDISRYLGSTKGGMSPAYHMLNRGKRSVVLDLKSAEGQEAVRKLIAETDVLITNVRQAAMQRLDLGFEEAKALKPDIIYCSILGYGETGPRADHPAFDPILQCLGGMVDEQRDLDSKIPRFVRTSLCDKLTGLTAAQAIGAALYSKAQTGQGQHVTVSLLDSVVSFLWVESSADCALLDREGVNVGPAVADQYSLTKFKNGWATMSPTTDHAFTGMCKVFDVPVVDALRTPALRAQNPALRKQLWEEIARKALDMDVDETVAKLEACDSPCGKVVALADVPDMPQAQANELFSIVDHPVMGRVQQARLAARFSETPFEPGAAAPKLGQHTDEVLRELGLK